MAKLSMFPEISSEMKKRGETQQDLARILDLDVSQVSRKLRGEIQWSIGDIEVLIAHYCRDFYELFRRREEMNKDDLEN